jgi:cold shock CspA family protein
VVDAESRVFASSHYSGTRLDGTLLWAERLWAPSLLVGKGIHSREASDAMRRRLEDSVCHKRDAVKTHEAAPHARVGTLFREEGYGFLETPDGREIYFHSNSLLPPGFFQLEVGTEVQFSEEQGSQGPQASMVIISGKSHA